MNLIDKKEGKSDNTLNKESFKKQTTMISELVAKEELSRKDVVNSNQNFKSTILGDNQIRNVKNNKNYGNSKFGLNQNNVDIGPFVPAGSNFEYKNF